MGIVNVTPDSFSDAGECMRAKDAIARAQLMITQGADIIDIGGESTRPGAAPVSWREELKRILPVVKALKKNARALVSCDTSKFEVACEALAQGADIINDVTALRGDTRIARECARAGAGVILMHMRGAPATMQRYPRYKEVTREITQFLRQRIRYALEEGVLFSSIAVDPGIGFGKTLAHNIEIIHNAKRLHLLRRPVLLGMSRKSFIGALVDKKPKERLSGSIAACVYAMQQGVDIVRVHDVAETRDALRVAEALITQKVR